MLLLLGVGGCAVCAVGCGGVEEVLLRVFEEVAVSGGEMSLKASGCEERTSEKGGVQRGAVLFCERSTQCSG